MKTRQKRRARDIAVLSTSKPKKKAPSKKTSRSGKAQPQTQHQQTPLQQSDPINLQVNLPAEIARGCYSNFAQVTHTPEEFIFDFFFLIGNTSPGPPVLAGQAVSRVVCSPAHAKRLLETLQRNIKKWESQFPATAPSSDQQPNS